MTDGGSSIEAVRRLLATLVAAKPHGRIAELGTAYGEGASAMVAALPSDATFVTVENDPERFRLAAQRLAGTRAEMVLGDWRELLPERGPFDLVFLDAGDAAESAALAISMLAPGGILVKDDLTPGRTSDGDPVRQALLGDPRLLACEIQTTASTAAIVAVRRSP
ncbi:O-methyltransferase [Conexibacter sp. S30A1]|uniref:O-methyltransferase n=1 Tax=Conexibacter sp. S30A1 TaxID=2937800 RepID=UPI0020108139|nr:class I SAM-dependent methyltransferase [Conexibacter sp. S30A1]